MLRDEVKALSGNKRKFFLLRVADVDTELARNLCGVKKGTYNSWLQHSDFVELYRRRDALAAEYKQEAIQLLRRDNQLEAVLLEAKIVAQMKAEIETGEYNLVRTNLARAVYDKLMSDLDVVPQVQALTWEQRIGQIIMNKPDQIVEGEVVDGQFKAVSEQESQSEESQSQQESE